jgi:hypothetical protein
VNGTHEDFKRDVHGRGPSDRNFGSVFAAAFFFLGLWPLHRGRPVRIWCVVLSAGFLAVTLIRPSVLHPLNRLWTQLGILLGRVVSPVATALLFFLVFTPAALVLRWMGKDLLHTAADSAAETYWIPCESADASPSLANQF